MTYDVIWSGNGETKLISSVTLDLDGLGYAAGKILDALIAVLGQTVAGELSYAERPAVVRHGRR
jgi:hypothetical protein